MFIPFQLPLFIHLLFFNFRYLFIFFSILLFIVVEHSHVHSFPLSNVSIPVSLYIVIHSYPIFYPFYPSLVLLIHPYSYHSWCHFIPFYLHPYYSLTSILNLPLFSVSFVIVHSSILNPVIYSHSQTHHSSIYSHSLIITHYSSYPFLIYLFILTVFIQPHSLHPHRSQLSSFFFFLIHSFIFNLYIYPHYQPHH